MQNLKTLLEQLNIPVAYDHFNTETNPPFIVFKRYSQNNFGADDIVYEKINNYYVYLVTEYKDAELEEELENVLTEAGIFFNVESEDYVDDEKCYQIVYSIGYKEPKIED
jgi:hypothetical protein